VVGKADGGEAEGADVKKGHDGKVGNELADSRAKREVWMGKRMHMPDIVTPAGNTGPHLPGNG